MTAFLVSLLGIILINIVLSGDNALVIGMAARNLQPRQRRWAILAGGAAAIVLRVIFTFVAVLLLRVPLLEALGGLLLVWIAFKLLREGEEAEVAGKESILGAVWTIVFADMVMSLDNMLAVAGAANGSDLLVFIGLLLSMPLILFGATLIARLLNRYSWLMIVGSAVLTITAANMVVSDEVVGTWVAGWHDLALAGLAAGFTVLVLAPTLLRWRRIRLERLEEHVRHPDRVHLPE
ncbi:MAG TPA: YjbE family putative metal transport protein [Thermomicrobiaceae bacterium]|nr:YjbE family putative metal transport protein [Thermomicrobiaceae bacterium]